MGLMWDSEGDGHLVRAPGPMLVYVVSLPGKFDWRRAQACAVIVARVGICQDFPGVVEDQPFSTGSTPSRCTRRGRRYQNRW